MDGIQPLQKITQTRACTQSIRLDRRDRLPCANSRAAVQHRHSESTCSSAGEDGTPPSDPCSLGPTLQDQRHFLGNCAAQHSICPPPQRREPPVGRGHPLPQAPCAQRNPHLPRPTGGCKLLVASFIRNVSCFPCHQRRVHVLLTICQPLPPGPWPGSSSSRFQLRNRNNQWCDWACNYRCRSNTCSSVATCAFLPQLVPHCTIGHNWDTTRFTNDGMVKHWAAVCVWRFRREDGSRSTLGDAMPMFSSIHIIDDMHEELSTACRSFMFRKLGSYVFFFFQIERNVTRSRWWPAHQSRHSCLNSSSTAVVEGVSPSTPNPPLCSRRERPKDLAALQANNVLQWRNQACLIDSRSCGGSLLSPADSRNLEPPISQPNTANSGWVFSNPPWWKKIEISHADVD